MFAGRGDDVVVYSMAGNLGAGFKNVGAHDEYDGGTGSDTLVLQLTYGEAQLASVQQDIAAFQDFLARRANPHSDNGREFEFKSFNLDVRNFEALQVQLVNTGADRARRQPARRTRTPRSSSPARACWRTTATPTTSTCFRWSRAAPPAPKARPSCSPPTAATATTRAARSSCRSSAPGQTTTDTFSYTDQGSRRRDRHARRCESP